MSPSFSISWPEFKKVLMGFVMAEAGALLFAATNWFSSGSLDWHLLIALEGAAFISTLVNFLRKYLPSTTPKA